MDAVDALVRRGGVARRDQLLGLVTPGTLRAALLRGDVRRVARGRYVLPSADDALAAAVRLNGALALRSAALHHGWPVKWPPDRPEVAVPRTRRRVPSRGVRLVWDPEAEPGLLVTSPLRTVLMSARALPFDEALSIADSALRTGALTRRQLRAAADEARGAGSARIRRVAREADPRAANPFESVLRATALEAGHRFVPQLGVDVGARTVHPDLVHPGRRVVLEADSWTWHTGKQAHVADCRRYNALVAHRWNVLRFTWEDVMFDPAYVREVIAMLVEHDGPAEVGLRGSHSA